MVIGTGPEPNVFGVRDSGEIVMPDMHPFAPDPLGDNVLPPFCKSGVQLGRVQRKLEKLPGLLILRVALIAVLDDPGLVGRIDNLYELLPGEAKKIRFECLFWIHVDGDHFQTHHVVLPLTDLSNILDPEMAGVRLWGLIEIIEGVNPVSHD